MSAYPPTVADHHKPRRLREATVRDIAGELVAEARKRRYELRLWLLPDGEFVISATTGKTNDGLMQHNAASLVGTYSGEATTCDVVEDVWVRAEQIGMEWER